MAVRSGDDDRAIGFRAALQVGLGKNVERAGDIQKLDARYCKDGDGSRFHLTVSRL